MRTQPRVVARHGKVVGQRGFTTVEVVIVMVISLAVAAMAIPGYSAMMRYLHIAGDARDLNGVVAQAKMQAASDFTHARAYADLQANTFHIEVWDKTANGGAGCWKTAGDSVNRCTGAASPVLPLSQGVAFGFGNVGAGSPNPQIVIAQAPACGKVAAVAGSTYTPLANTACIEFNSRGLPVNSAGTPTANDALYVTDGDMVYGLTVNAGGLIQIWETPLSQAAWSPR
jgi:type II secretory pathway pseudopilin PulG